MASHSLARGGARFGARGRSRATRAVGTFTLAGSARSRSACTRTGAGSARTCAGASARTGSARVRSTGNARTSGPRPRK